MALTLAVSAMHGCQLIGMPECDVILAHAVVYLARFLYFFKILNIGWH